ncbi:uncharacterized protein LOC105693389 isoform X1 [Athalia rosae]|uniref:uncharacterized protein LOC105693389 isoform X1 n=2 Tax=Athalia rosae TaxID=37344 RepID=UPI002033955D|nr:uncharacterized protein LOC105693389 isoform X1 [Athalia rosae]
MSFGRHKISGKRYLNVSDSSSDEEYRSRKSSFGHSDESFENHSQILKKADTSTSSLDVRVSRRGRSTSKRPCMNKNARAARENRIRKKKHLEQVENKLSFYQQKNKSLVNVIQKQDIDIKKLQGEVTYLRCILKNDTNITALLQSMNEGLSKSSIAKTSRLRNKLCDDKSTLKQIVTNRNDNIANNLSMKNIGMMKSPTNNTIVTSESDHTYTIPKAENILKPNPVHGDLIGDEQHGNYKDSAFDNSVSLGFKKQTSMTPPSSNSDDLINVNFSDAEINEWPGLNVDIYDNLTNFDHLLSPSDTLGNLNTLYDESNVLEQFRDAGICLHVNSEKVSLEFCSICHMNSLHSTQSL